MGKVHLRLVTSDDSAGYTAQQAEMEECRAAAEQWANYYFDRPTDHDGKYPETPRERFPMLAKVLVAYLTAMADEVVLAPDHYDKLCAWLYDEWFLERAKLHGLCDAHLPMHKRAMDIVRRQDAKALNQWVKKLQWGSRRLATDYRNCVVRLSRRLRSMGITTTVSGKDGKQMTPEAEVALEAFQLLWCMLETPDRLNNEQPDPDEDLPVLDEDDLIPLDIRNNLKSCPERKDCPERGGLRLVED